MTARYRHTLPFGAELTDSNRTRFRLWAPDQRHVRLIIPGLSPITLRREDDGWFEGEVYCGAGTLYQYRLDDDLLVPDPASRLQAGDVHDPSVVCDPREFRWYHTDWRGRPWHEMVIYELHVGCVGGFERAAKQLPELAELGITAIELMPIADFPGTRNWGYDGVLPFAPDTCYGSPAQLKQLIDTAHGLGLCVYLDVVYNHFGPDGNYLPRYASPFFDTHKTSPWGAAIDFSQPAVRDFFIENVLYWLLEYRFDGLRFDAAHWIGDAGWLDAMAAVVRARVEPGRHIHLMLENEHNHADHLEQGFDAQWNDDAHNALHVLLTGECDSYYRHFAHTPAAQLARCLGEGFAFQGEVVATAGAVPNATFTAAKTTAASTPQTRGTPSAHLPPHAFIFFLQNHDQIGNRAFGERLITLIAPDDLRAAVTLQLLTPHIPLIFMGEEWGARSPFLFFTDFHSQLARDVRDGRRREFAEQSAFTDTQLREKISDPNAVLTFTSSIPDRNERHLAAHREVLALYRQLLALRRRFITPALKGCRSVGTRAANSHAVRASWRLGNGSVLTINANFGRSEIHLDTPPEADAGELLFDSRTLAPTEDRHCLPPHTTRVYLQRELCVSPLRESTP